MAIFDELKSIAKTFREADKIPQYEQILNVQEKLLEMQNKIFELDKENKDLKEKLCVKENLVFENNTYWIIKDSGKDGPFCSCCWDSEKGLVRLHKNKFSDRIYCPKCKNNADAGKGLVFIPKDQGRNSAR